MTTAEIETLRQKFQRFATATGDRAVSLVALKGEELRLLEHTLRSLVIWRKWLVPDD